LESGIAALAALYGSGVICEISALHAVVIPAKAGIHSAGHSKYSADGLDSRLRGNDGWLVREVIPNDGTTRCLPSLIYPLRSCNIETLVSNPLANSG
jgi:hypothetical protein